MKGNFDRACVYFKKCYALCREVGAPEDLHSAAVQYGIASAHVAMEGFAERLTLTDLSSVEVCVCVCVCRPPSLYTGCVGQQCCSLPVCMPVWNNCQSGLLAIQVAPD